MSTTLKALNSKVEGYTCLTIDGIFGSVAAGFVAEGDATQKLMTGLATAGVHQVFHNKIVTNAPPNMIKDFNIPAFDGIVAGGVAYFLGGTTSAIAFGALHAPLHFNIV